MPLETSIRTFLTTNFYVANPEALDAEASLLDNGIIDSTGVLELITFIENDLGVKVEDHEMLPDNLDSIRKIASFVERKKSAA